MDDILVRDSLEYIDEINVFDMKVTLMAPKIFYYLQQSDYPFINLKKSLDLKNVMIIYISKNRQSINSISKISGGKSGEFFFFSYDNKLVLKTISQTELRTIRKRLVVKLYNIFKIYGDYLFNHSDSFIAKIYGIYSF